MPRAKGTAPASRIDAPVWVGFRTGAFLRGRGLLHLPQRLPKAVSYALLRNERELRATLVQFPNHLSKLMQDEHGLHRLVEDQQ